MWWGLFKREFGSFFNNYSGYFIMAIYVVLAMLTSFFFGLYFLVDNPAMLSFFAFQPQIMAIIVPAITMRSWSDEYKTGTVETLLTFPLKTSTMVTAKFFACWLFSVLLLIFSLPLLVTTAFVVEVDYLNIISSYIGAILMLGVFCALGCVISSISSIPVVAYLITVLFNWILVEFNFTPLVRLISDKIAHSTFYFETSLNFSTQYQGFVEGQIGVENFAYFCSLSLILLVFNSAVIESRRHK